MSTNNNAGNNAGNNANNKGSNNANNNQGKKNGQMQQAVDVNSMQQNQNKQGGSDKKGK